MTLLFAGLYQHHFFKNAGITYDVNQPHIDFDMYSTGERKLINIKDTLNEVVIYKPTCDGETVQMEFEKTTICELNYQPIDFLSIWRETILTSLMQEPTDFFQVASTYNMSMDRESDNENGAIIDQQKAASLFHWILILQILISWIFFGVFISLLYNKFRNES